MLLNSSTLRALGETGQKYGCSAVLCHIHHVRKRGVYLLHTANTGLGEAVLCRGGRVVPLTTAHSPATNPSERTRIVEAKGFISQVRITLPVTVQLSCGFNFLHYTC